MNEAAKEARRQYKRNWNKANPDKVRAYQERYWNKKAQEAAAQTADTGGDDPEQEATAK